MKFVGSVENCTYLGGWQQRYGRGRTDELLSHYLHPDRLQYCMQFFFLKPLITIIACGLFNSYYFYFFTVICLPIAFETFEKKVNHPS